ncbi:hypothetical protein BJY52DRAFT_1195339 [Lactarius psammicola]|nr:hypothetical protein BJY52DRAFT_1195339 [Lactarius psammicola]
MSWLHRFYGVWKLVELMASFANAPGLGQRLLDICAKIEAEARPYAMLDWIHLFPRISAGDSECLILFFSTLNHAYAGALIISPPLAGEPCAAFGLAMADFEDLFSKGMITEDKFNWCRRKLVCTKIDFNMERIALAWPITAQLVLAPPQAIATVSAIQQNLPNPPQQPPAPVQVNPPPRMVLADLPALKALYSRHGVNTEEDRKLGSIKYVTIFTKQLWKATKA